MGLGPRCVIGEFDQCILQSLGPRNLQLGLNLIHTPICTHYIMLLNCFELNRLFYLPRNVLIIYKIHTFKKTANNHFEKAVFLNVSEMHIKNPENVFHFVFVPRHSS